MTFIRYKKFGKQEYAYEVKSYWDSNSKKPKQQTRYLGVVIDKEKKIFEKKALLRNSEKLILDFGDTYILNEFFEKTQLTKIIEKVFGDKKDFILALITYRLCYPSAMRFSREWFEGNYVRIKYKNVDLCSQRISDFFKIIGDEKLQRQLLKNISQIILKQKKAS